LGLAASLEKPQDAALDGKKNHEQALLIDFSKQLRFLMDARLSMNRMIMIGALLKEASRGWIEHRA